VTTGRPTVKAVRPARFAFSGGLPAVRPARPGPRPGSPRRDGVVGTGARRRPDVPAPARAPAVPYLRM